MFCLSFRWLNPLFRIGYKRRLEEDDMYEVLEEDKSEKVGQDLNRYQESVVLFWFFCGFSVLKLEIQWLRV